MQLNLNLIKIHDKYLYQWICDNNIFLNNYKGKINMVLIEIYENTN